MNELSQIIIGAAIEVHRELGPGLLEQTYEACLFHELTQRGLKVERQVILPIQFKGLIVKDAYRIDLLVEDKIILELKSVEKIDPIHTAQILTYLKLSKKPLGLLINFNVPLLKDGIRRLANNLPE
ncbi:MAG: GxxExxY protein [Roseibacillus sp.]